MAQPDQETLSKAMQEIEMVIQSSQISSKLFNACFFPRFFNILRNGKGEGNSASRAVRHLQIHLLNSANPITQIFTALLEASGVAPNSTTLHRRVVVQAIDVCNPALKDTKAQEVSDLLDIQTDIQKHFGAHVLTRGIALDFPQATEEEIKTKTLPLMFNLTAEALIKTGFSSIGSYEKDLEEAKIPFDKFDNDHCLKRSDTVDVKGLLAYYPGATLKEVKKEHPTTLMTECMWDICFAVTMSRTVYNSSLFLSGILDQAVFHRSFDDEKVVLHISVVALAVLHNLFSEARSLPFFAVDNKSTLDSLIVHSSVKDTQGKLQQLKKERDERSLKSVKEEIDTVDAEKQAAQALQASHVALPTVADADFSEEQLKEYLKASQGLSDDEIAAAISKE